MLLIVVLLLLALVLGGVGFTVHWLWIIALVLLVIWAIGWLAHWGGPVDPGVPPGRRRWYGRW
jgi:hypothetical protein